MRRNDQPRRVDPIRLAAVGPLVIGPVRLAGADQDVRRPVTVEIAEGKRRWASRQVPRVLAEHPCDTLSTRQVDLVRSGRRPPASAAPRWRRSEGPTAAAAPPPHNTSRT